MADRIDLIDGIGPIAKRYDALIIDLWGVIHDGVNLLPGAADCLTAVRDAGIPYALLSNAPRRALPLVDAMVQMGLPADYAPIVLSSGEATRLALEERADAWFEGVGRRCYHIGPERDENLFDGLDIDMVKAPEDADLIVNTGPWDVEETVADYEPVLRAGAAAGVKMVCANPDLEVIRGGQRVVCAGALAVRYEELGGDVIYYGKPKRPIYDSCFRRLGNPDPARVLAIGDSLRTDIAGAALMGMDSVLVVGGIHGDEFAGAEKAEIEHRIYGKCAESGNFPIAAIPSFRW